jgi:GNAT superfamily N-acetyltransferase
MPDLVIRPAVQDDFELLWDFLAMAAYQPDAEAAKAVPSIAKYLVGWQRPGDFGFIAEQNGEIIGAAWARRFSAEGLKFPYGDEGTPKVSISVKSNARGQGVGEKLMRALIGEAALGAGLAFVSACVPKIPPVASTSASAFATSPVPLSRTALAACRSAWHEESPSDAIRCRHI